MTPEQKQRIAHEISNWRNARNDHSSQITGDRMSALLQEMVDAPEPEPFGYFKSEPFGWTDCAETDDGAIALYTAPPAPSVPDGWRGLTDVEWMNIVNFDSAYSSYDKEGAVNEAVKRTEAKLKELNAAQQQEPPADLARDAERWDKYMYLIGINSDKAAEILDIVDAAIEREKCGA